MSKIIKVNEVEEEVYTKDEYETLKKEHEALNKKYEDLEKKHNEMFSQGQPLPEQDDPDEAFKKLFNI